MFLNISIGLQGSAGFHVGNNWRGQPADWIPVQEEGVHTGSQAPFTDALLWPSPRFMSGDPGTPLAPFSEDAVQMNRYGVYTAQDSGIMSAKKITGITRDSAGNPLGSCIVQGFITSTDTFVGQVTSDSGGYYELPTIYPSTQHYLVAYKPGSPDVAGASLNTIVPV